MNEHVGKLREKDREIFLLIHTAAVLGWDQETYMPPRAVEERAEQLSLLEGLIHQKVTDHESGELLARLGVDQDNPGGTDDLAELDRAFVREMGRRYFRNTKLPVKLVTDLARETSLGQAKWAEARQASDFAMFLPHLKTIVDLSTEKAYCLGFKDSVYDPLLDQYEPYMSSRELDGIFDRLQARLKPLLDRIRGSKTAPRKDFLERDFDIVKQRDFGIDICRRMGFDFDSGRLDVSAHPFSTTLGKNDIRITTRYNKNFFATGLFGIIHECGHGLYEAGFADNLGPSLLANGVSLGIHESQSRFWENMIARSLPFWQAFYPGLRRVFPGALDDITCQEFYGAINAVEPSLVRVEADEVTYSLHIVIRYRIEKALLSQQVRVEDLPEMWNREYGNLLGVTPRNDGEGVLQDIHWSMGAFGYFPTYALGNLYSAQFRRTMLAEMPSCQEEIGKGNLTPVREWLREKIHAHGSVYPATELLKRVTGEGVNPDYFVGYLTEKLGGIYGF